MATEKISSATEKQEKAQANLRSTLARVAPGTALRDGLERILRGRTGGLIVLGYDKVVDHMSTGGFELDVSFTATRLRELAKMDGGIITDAGASRILAAAVQLIPDNSIPTDEQGTRHRTADRVAKQTGFPVVSVSKSMNIIALYLNGGRYVLEDTTTILARANQALSTLERYKHRFDEVTSSLLALEVEELVTVRDVTVAIQRTEMLLRIAREIDHYAVELGVDGRLVRLQLEELVAGVEEELILLLRDYVPEHTGRKKVRVEPRERLTNLPDAELVDLANVARALELPGTVEGLDQAVSPHGYRLLSRVPRLPGSVIDRLMDTFDDVPSLLNATIDDLQTVEGIGETRARTIREGLSRLAETSILERYV